MATDNSLILPPILELRNVTQTYKDKTTKKDFTVFENLNFVVEDVVNIGQFVTIMGASGCGKSTLLRYCTGLQRPTSGEVYIGGKLIEKKQSNPMVFQHYSSLEWYTVLKNVALPLRLRGVPKQEAHEKAMEMIKIVGLAGHEYKYAKYPLLSGGQLQRVAIARSLVANPNILFLDEPFGALDGKTRAEMQFFLLELYQQNEHANLNPTNVLVTHDPREAALLGNDIIIMGANPGRIIVHIKSPLPALRDRSIRNDPTYLNLVAYIERVIETGKTD